MPTRIHHVHITVEPNQVAAARAFYGAFLGLPEIPKPPELADYGGLWLKVGEQDLHIGVQNDASRHLNKAHIAYEVEDLETWRQKIIDYGLSIEPDTVQFAGYRRFQFRDPFGNRVEFLEAE